MSDTELQQSQQTVQAGVITSEQQIESKIDKEIEKLKYYLEQTNELIEENDLREIETVNKRTKAILDEIYNLVSTAQEMKVEQGKDTPRAIRQWKKSVREKYMPWVSEMNKLSDFLVKRQERISTEEENRKREAKRIEEERDRETIRQQEREILEEKLQAELKLTEKKLEMEKAARATQAKLPKLKISPFNGTVADWVRFENMFVTQVDAKPISDEEKFGYLLEMVNGKVREKISNLKPSSVGYSTAWGRLKKEYGQTKLVVNAHIDEVVNLATVKGSSYERVLGFYESLSKNYDALQTLGEHEKLDGFVMCTINKLPHVKPDLVRIDDNWEEWKMCNLIDSLQKWLRRNKVEDSNSKQAGDPRRKRENSLFTQRGGNENNKGKKTPCCIFCKSEHWSDTCKSCVTTAQRKTYFSENKLCFNCGIPGHRARHCRSRGCFHCGEKHHTSLHDPKDPKGGGDPVLTGYSTANEEVTLPSIIPVKVEGEVFWAFLDTGSGKNFISMDAIKKLQLLPARQESKEILTVNGTKRQYMPIYNVTIESLDGTAKEDIELAGSTMQDLTTIKRLDLNKLKWNYEHTKDKRFYVTTSGEYPIHMILGDSTFCKIKTEEIFKGKDGDPIVEGTSFGWLIHGGEVATNVCMFTRESTDYEKLYTLDVLGVEDRGENDQLDVCKEFKESITRTDNGRYEVNVPWIPGQHLPSSNLEPSRKRLTNVCKKINRDEKLKKDYEEIIEKQLESGIIEAAPEEPTGERVYYMPHKPVVRNEATSTKVRMVFDASAKPTPNTNSVNDCMFTGPPLQPLLWDILIRARMAPQLILADIQKAFLQIGLKEDDRDAFRFLFNINGIEKHFRFTRIPFGVESSPFMLGATVQHHLDHQSIDFEDTVQALKDNTYVDNIMQIGSDSSELEKFKSEATEILESAKLPIHKWESNVEALDSQDMPNPSKILGLAWDKKEDELWISVPEYSQETKVTKKSIVIYLGKVYDPLGIVSPTMAEGKRIYREACDETNSWDADISQPLKHDWWKWTKQLRNVKIPRSITKGVRKIKEIHLHIFADASALACSCATIAVVDHSTGTVKGLLTAKARISKRNTSIPRLELISGQMAANMAKNVCQALKQLPIVSVTVWMDSIVALFWILNPAKSWKTFVANRVKKMASITSDLNIKWKYCPSKENIADLGSRGASINRMECNGWFHGPDWLLDEEKQPEQPNLSCTKEVNVESKPLKEVVFQVAQKEVDEWDWLLERSSYWKTLRVTAWCLRFKHNCLAKGQKLKRKSGPLQTEEIENARNYWVKRVQGKEPEVLESPGWKFVRDKETDVLKCEGRISKYRPIYINGGRFVEKLIQHCHEQTMHLGVASTMAFIRENWWIPQLRAKVKKVIRNCNVCKVFSAKPFTATATAQLPEFRTTPGRPFEVTGVDFAGPLIYKVTKKEDGKCYIIIFTCATSRAVHLELAKSQTAEEFQAKLNAFITRKTRPRRIISDNATTFIATAKWIKLIRKSERLHDYLASQDIKWTFNLAKSPWWGGLYERLIKEIKTTLYKTLGKTHLLYGQLETVILDIDRHLNNHPLTYVESGQEEE